MLKCCIMQMILIALKQKNSVAFTSVMKIWLTYPSYAVGLAT